MGDVFVSERAISFSVLGEIEIDSAWGGFVDCTPDAVPVVSQVDGMEGLVLAAGCSGHGFGLGPGLGYLAAELVVNDTPLNPWVGSDEFDRAYRILLLFFWSVVIITANQRWLAGS